MKQGYRYYKLVKTFWKFFRNYDELLSKFGVKSAKEYISKGISHPSFYGDLINKLRRVKGDTNFRNKCIKIIKRLKYRGYNPKVIKRTLVTILNPFTVQYREILQHCTLTDCSDGTLWRALSKPRQRRQGPDDSSSLEVGRTPRAERLELVSANRAHMFHRKSCMLLITLYISHD